MPQLTLEYWEDDGWFIGRLVEVPGIFSQGETVEELGVQIFGPVNLVSSIPYHASQMYSKNMSKFLLHLVKKGKLELNMEDEITRETLVTKDGQVVHSRVKELLSKTSKERCAT